MMPEPEPPEARRGRKGPFLEQQREHDFADTLGFEPPPPEL